MAFLQPKTYNLKPNSGQTMLLMVLVLTASLLSVAMISGLVMLFQIRQSGDFTNSAEAIFAAETGAEWWRMSMRKGIAPPTPTSSTVNNILRNDNDSSFEIFPVAGNPNQVKIVGTSGNSKRALLVTVSGAKALIDCSTGPDVVLALDNSDSVTASNLVDEKSAAKAFVDKLLPAPLPPNPARISIVSFEEIASLVLSRSSNENNLNSAIDNISLTNGATNIDDALFIATSELTLPRDRSDASNPDYIVLVSDGDPTVFGHGSVSPSCPLPNCPSAARDAAADTATAAKNLDIKIMAIGIDTNANTSDFLLNRIVTDSSHYYEVSSYSELVDKLPDIITCN